MVIPCRIISGLCPSTLGDVIYLEALGTRMIVLNSYKAAQDLLGKKAVYADRPNFPFVCELMGLDRLIVLSRYNERWRRQRKALHPVLNKGAIGMYSGEQQKAAHAYLRTLLTSPKDFHKNANL